MRPVVSKRLIGQMGEEAALAWLKKKGHRLLARNWRCRLGEIDLITAEGNQTVFVEVRSRTSDLFGAPAESVTSQKQTRLRRLAEYYLLSQGLAGRSVRFDVVAVRLTPEGQVTHIQHLPGAF